ncbi:hypothetical protein BC834DRAFT_900700 [Gloeopeniophorella convolvens]|nr:hypothetical protein BC834DRAFT_900700 [Gloeopeniophorella convolvens]
MMPQSPADVDLERGDGLSILPTVAARPGNAEGDRPTSPGATSSFKSATQRGSALTEKPQDESPAGDVQVPNAQQVKGGPHQKDSARGGYSDPSAKIWSVYLSQAEKFDKEQSESWTGDTEGILVFTGLFSATVAAFILVSYQDLQPNSSDATVLLLLQISQQLSALSNGTSFPVSSSIPGETDFKPSASSVRVNLLWFISLTLSLVCALLATLMQQWTRRYLQVADRPYSPPKRARIRTFFAEGVDKFRLNTAVEALPVLLHASVVLFYIGLVDFLININHTIAFTLLAFVSVFAVSYVLLTILPLVHHSAPYQTPLSALFWFLREAIPLAIMWFRLGNDAKEAIQKRREKIRHGMRRAFEKTAMYLDNAIDIRALIWTLTALDEDDELEDFLDGLPGLFQLASRDGEQLQKLRKKLKTPVTQVLERVLTTCTTGFLPEEIHKHRLAACIGAVWCFPELIKRHYDAVRKQWDQPTGDMWGPLSAETWAVAQTMTAHDDPETALRAHCVQALLAAARQNGQWHCPDDEAAALLQRQLGASPALLGRFAADRPGGTQLAIAARLLGAALPLLERLSKHEGMSGRVVRLRDDLRDVVNALCLGLSAQGAPKELQARLVGEMDVLSALWYRGDPIDSTHLRRHYALDLEGPWRAVMVDQNVADGLREADGSAPVVLPAQEGRTRGVTVSSASPPRLPSGSRV